MCGVIGIVSRKPGGLFGKDLDLFEQGLIINTLRGRDSVGAFTAFKNKQAMAIKHGSNPFELFKTKEWATFRSDAISKGRFVIGHNRAATRGETSTDNAHPFVEENIILVHNGTIFNQESLTTNKCEVDSNAIAHALVENEPEEVFPYIHGAFACVWYDTNKHKLFMLRNNDRPLSVIVTDDSYLISSEPWIMAMPAQRQDRKLGDMVNVEPGDLYSFDMEGKYEVTKLDLTKKVKRGNPRLMNLIDDTGTIITENDESFFGEGTEEAETPSPQTMLLRAALIQQRLRKETEHEKYQSAMKNRRTERSTSCALTQRGEYAPTLTSTTENDSISNLTDMSEESNLIDGGRSRSSAVTTATFGWAGPTLVCHPTIADKDALTNAKQVVTTPLYPVGRVVLFRVLKNTSDFTNRIRFQGKLMEPGMEMVDVCGFVPEGTMYNPTTLATGQIFFTTASVHGIMCHLTDVKRCDWTPVHATEVPKHLWNIAFRECECEECDRELTLADKAFTSVKTKAVFNKTRSGIPINTITCICADCLQDKLPEGPYRETFIAKRKNAKAASETADAKPYVIDPRDPVQTGLVLRKAAVIDNDGIIRIENTPTVH